MYAIKIAAWSAKLEQSNGMRDDQLQPPRSLNHASRLGCCICFWMPVEKAFCVSKGFMISSGLYLLSKLVVRITFNYVLCGMSVANAF